ncbi:MAG: hypothetical protein HGB06_09815 [Chlorobaculum sp.]|nr:hypothetical protein [Chlorobaculum sp.]
MAKAKKEENNSKPRGKMSLFRAVLIMLGADIILLFVPGYGMLSMGQSTLFNWLSLIAGLALLAFGFNGLFRKE